MIEVNTYNTYYISYEEKKEYIKNKYNLNEYMLNVIFTVVYLEGKSGSYEDCYAVINTIYNRTISDKWVRSVSNRFGNNKGKNIYYQTIYENQFTVYNSSRYKKYFGNVPKYAKEAVVDFLYSNKIMHNYLSFRSNDYNKKDVFIAVDGGNKYFNELKKN